MTRALALLFLASTSAIAQPFLQREPRPFTEVDEAQAIADFWELAGKEQSLIAGIGGGYLRGGAATLDVAYRRKGFHSLWDLLPTTIGTGVWLRPAETPHVTLPLSIGWTFVLGLFEGPYVAVNGLGLFSRSELEAGFEFAVGYELRANAHWSLMADARLVGIWPVTDAAERSPWDGRASLMVRRYLGVDTLR